MILQSTLSINLYIRYKQTQVLKSQGVLGQISHELITAYYQISVPVSWSGS